MDEQQKEKNGCNKTPDVCTKKNKNSFWNIDQEMFRFKLHFFLLNGGLGASVPYVSVLARNRIGFHATSMAAMIVAQRFLFIFTKPLIGYLADYFKKLKAIIYILTVIQGVFFFLLLTIPQVEEQTLELFYTLKVELKSERINITIPNKKCKNLETSDNALLKQFFKSNNLETTLYCSFTDKPLKEAAFDFHLAAPIQTYATNESNLSSFEKCSETLKVKIFNDSQWTLNVLKQEIFVPIKNSNVSFSKLCLFCNSLKSCCESSCSVISDEEKRFENVNTDFRTYKYWTFSLLYMIASASTNGLFTLSDTACCETVQKTGADFGRQRVWSSIGWGVMCLIGGFLNDFTDDYVTSFAFAAVLSTLSLWNLSKVQLIQPHFSKNILKDVASVWKSKEFIVFEIGVLLHGIFIGFIWFNLFWFLTEIGGSRFLCGISLFMQCVVGIIPFMFFSGWVINKIGHFNVLSLSLMTYFVRFFGYSQITNPWHVLPFECLHGLTYGVFLPAVVSFAKMNAKPGTEASTQAILFATFDGLGAGIGSVLAGIGFDCLGGHKTYFYASMFAGCSMLISILFTLSVKGRKRDFKITSSVQIPSPQAKVPLS